MACSQGHQRLAHRGEPLPLQLGRALSRARTATSSFATPSAPTDGGSDDGQRHGTCSSATPSRRTPSTWGVTAVRRVALPGELRDRCRGYDLDRDGMATFRTRGSAFCAGGRGIAADAHPPALASRRPARPGRARRPDADAGDLAAGRAPADEASGARWCPSLRRAG